MMKMLTALSLELLVSNKPLNFEHRSEHICWSVSGLLCTDHLKLSKGVTKVVQRGQDVCLAAVNSD